MTTCPCSMIADCRRPRWTELSQGYNVTGDQRLRAFPANGWADEKAVTGKHAIGNRCPSLRDALRFSRAGMRAAWIVQRGGLSRGRYFAAHEFGHIEYGIGYGARLVDTLGVVRCRRDFEPLGERFVDSMASAAPSGREATGPTVEIE